MTELHFEIGGIDSESVCISEREKRAIEKAIINKFESIYNGLVEQGEKGIPRAWNPDKFLFSYDLGKVIVSLYQSTKNLNNLLEWFVDRGCKKIKVGNKFTLSAPELVSACGEAWTVQDTIKLKPGERWRILRHNGVYFGDPYEPHGKKLKIGSELISMKPEDEEYVSLYAIQLAREALSNDVRKYSRELVFIHNYIKDLKLFISPELYSKISSVAPKTENEIDRFNNIFANIEKHLAQKREKTDNDKKADKLKCQELKRKYGFANVNGRKEKIGNYKAEIPGLFMGRGDNPKMGCIKKRLKSSDVILNLDKEAPIPIPSDGGKWKDIVFRPDVTWLATWEDRCTGGIKYVFLGATSKIKGESDMAKYEKARKLATLIGDIQNWYESKMKSSDIRDRQIGTIVYLIDNHAFRIGNEKGADEADTVGVSTLKAENIDPQNDGKSVIFDFLGKDSVPYHNTLILDPTAWKNLQEFKAAKRDPKAEIFDKVSSSDINAQLRKFMKGLTAKVFRTFRSSTKYLEGLNKIPKKAEIDVKISMEKDANLEVARFCNHQKKASAKTQIGIDNKKEEIAQLQKDVKKRGLDPKKKEKIKKDIEKLSKFVEEKEKTLALSCGTSKANYIDPRIVISWAKKNEIPLNKFYSPAQLEKFQWATQVADEKWDYYKTPIALEDQDTERESGESEESDAQERKPRKKSPTVKKPIFSKNIDISGAKVGVKPGSELDDLFLNEENIEIIHNIPTDTEISVETECGKRRKIVTCGGPRVQNETVPQPKIEKSNENIKFEEKGKKTVKFQVQEDTDKDKEAPKKAISSDQKVRSIHEILKKRPTGEAKVKKELPKAEVKIEEFEPGQVKIEPVREARAPKFELPVETEKLPVTQTKLARPGVVFTTQLFTDIERRIHESES